MGRIWRLRRRRNRKKVSKLCSRFKSQGNDLYPSKSNKMKYLAGVKIKTKKIFLHFKSFAKLKNKRDLCLITALQRNN